jgi:putative redox protein
MRCDWHHYRSTISCVIEVVGILDAQRRRRLMEIADRCPAHRTLKGEIDIVAEETNPTA